jgi:lon-related putative ATP-dependent protease
VKAQLARALVNTLARVESPLVRLLGMERVEGFVPAGPEGLALLHEFAAHPGWPGRAVAARLLGERGAMASVADQEAVWATLERLAGDPERWVREATSTGFGALLRASPERWGPRFLDAFGEGDQPEVSVRHALLFGVVPALRRGPEEARTIAVEVIDRAAGEDSAATRQLGALIVGRELAVELPGEAMRLVERWSEEDSVHQWQAARSLTKALREAEPDRSAAVVERLQVAENARVRNALRGALRDADDGTEGGAAQRDGAEADAASTGGGDDDYVPNRRALATAAAPPAAPPEGWQTTAEIPVSERVIDQVIGQDRAVEIVRLAALQRRFVLMVGEPGTGKSMLGAAMAEMMGAQDLEDVLVVPNPESRITPLVEVVPVGEGEAAVRDAKRRRGESESAISYLFWAASAAVSLIAGWYAYRTESAIPALIGGAIFVALLIARRFFRSTARSAVPKLLVNNMRAQEADRAPFVDATGFHAGALLGDVRHDPFQSGGYETPPHELVEAGAIHLAHRGVLFIDEVSTLSIESQQSLLTAIQEKRFPISGRTLGSSGTMMRSAAVPCDFLLMLAGNMQDVEKMHPALRSRVRGYGYEIYMNEDMPDTVENRLKVARFCAQEVRKDGKIPHLTRDAVDAIVEQARVRSGNPDRLTTRLRELGGLLRAAGDLAAQEGARLTEARHVTAARENTRTLEEQMSTRGIQQVSGRFDTEATTHAPPVGMSVGASAVALRVPPEAA